MAASSEAAPAPAVERPTAGGAAPTAPAAASPAPASPDEEAPTEEPPPALVPGLIPARVPRESAAEGTLVSARLSPAREQRRSSPRLRAPVTAVAGALAVLSIGYFGYFLTRTEPSVCDAAYAEASSGLSARMELLRGDGKTPIAHDHLTELGDRAQMAALNLKSCCTLLDAGQLDPERFVQCKGNVRTFAARLDAIADLARGVQGTAERTNAAPLTTGAAATATPVTAPPGAVERIATEVAAAKEISRTFNEQVVALREDMTLHSLRTTAPHGVTIEAQESEPNDDSLSTNQLALDSWVTAAISGEDTDFYTFTTPPTYRDVVRIELQNRSPLLQPRLDLYDARKSIVGTVNETTPGADIAYTFTAEPATTYIVRASNYRGSDGGPYLLRVAAQQAYDAHEPNDDILSAKAVVPADATKAGIMDKADEDFFSVRTMTSDTVLHVTLKNGSTTLRPEITIFDGLKAQIGTSHNATAGGDVSYRFRAEPQAIYYVRVRDYYRGAGGDYTLTVSPLPPGDG